MLVFTTAGEGRFAVDHAFVQQTAHRCDESPSPEAAEPSDAESCWSCCSTRATPCRCPRVFLRGRSGNPFRLRRFSIAHFLLGAACFYMCFFPHTPQAILMITCPRLSLPLLLLPPPPRLRPLRGCQLTFLTSPPQSLFPVTSLMRLPRPLLRLRPRPMYLRTFLTLMRPVLRMLAAMQAMGAAHRCRRWQRKKW